MRIAINCNVATETPKGIGKYLIDAINAFVEYVPDWEFILLSKHSLNNVGIDLNKKNVHYCYCPLPGFINRYQIWYNIVFPRKAKELNADIIWTPFPALPFFYSKRIKSLITVHDVVALEYANTQSWLNRIVNNIVFKRAILKSDFIWCNSNYTFTKVDQYFKERKSQNVVIGDSCGLIYRKKEISLSLRNSIKNSFGIKDKFLLFVGNLEPRKNISFLLGVIKELYSVRSDVQLLVVGGKGWKYSSIYSIVNDSAFPKESVIFANYIDNEMLVNLYNIADSLISTSINEGFGMPQLEAMKCGCPVITAHNSAMIEVVSGRGVTVKGWDVKRWIEAINEVLDSSSRNNTYELNEYDWKKIVLRVKEYIINNV